MREQCQESVEIYVRPHVGMRLKCRVADSILGRTRAVTKSVGEEKVTGVICCAH
jgi:hypothetical protein